MKGIRRVIGDRASATAIAVLAACILLLQGFVGGMTRSSMAASAVDPLHIICMSDGTTAGNLPSGDDGSSKEAADCPCASLCRLAATTPVAILPGTAFLGARDFRPLSIASFAAPQDVVPARRRLLPQPRAPPLS
ncbi:MAG: DUF2946 family protein [Pseudorhizobium sp.]